MKSQVAARKEQDYSEVRRVKRDLVNFDAQATGRTGVHMLRIVNISPLGLMARVDTPLAAGEKLIIDLPHVRSVEAAVRWVEDGRIGAEFLQAIIPKDYAAMLSFMPERQTAW